MRAIIVDWIIEVAIEYKLGSETCFLSVNYLDRFLSKKSVEKYNLQLVAVACIFIAGLN